MKSILALAALFACASVFVSKANGHGTPINAYVVASTGQLAVFDGYEPGVLESFGGSDVFTDAPGIGISSPFNGVQTGEAIRLNVVQGLLFWDGSNLAPTAETLLIDWPDDGGSSSVESYDVSATTGYQTGMLWGNYQPAGGTGSWDAHGDYALESANPVPGIYGVVFQLDSPNYLASEPFLVPLVYDPASVFGADDVASGIASLSQAVAALPTADFNRDTSVDDADLLVWQQGYGTSVDAALVDGDATGDGSVAGKDFLAWQQQHSAAQSIGKLLATEAVPEPSTLLLLAGLTTSNFVSVRNIHSFK